LSRLNTYDVRLVPHERQRYETCGDYYDEGLLTNVRVSVLGDARMEFCVMIHELIEEFLCKQRGIAEPDIKAFDEEFERRRQPGELSEPGFDFASPYFREHAFATQIEMQIAEEIGLDWAEYTERVNAL
jgi:hypothetical protein